MRIQTTIALLTGALALSAAPALAAGPPSGVPPTNPGTANMPSNLPGPGASLPAKARAYGVYCQNESKQHVAGQRGTPFSQCVTAMAKLTSGETNNPRTACKGESKRHVAGQRGTPFSRCVSGAAKLLQSQAQS